MIVTIDGPAGAGKSSVAQRLALRVGFQFLDTGAMYRAVTLAAKRAGHDWNNDEQLVQLATAQTITFQDHRTLLNGQDVSADIRTNEISQLVRYAANNPGVRQWLVERQRELGRDTNLVTEGRDQGTVVFPQAELKIFLTASPEERARRRWLDLRQRGEEVELADLLAQQRARDESDAAREVGPLKPAADALHLLTDGLTLAEVELRLEQMVRRRQQEILTRDLPATRDHVAFVTQSTVNSAEKSAVNSAEKSKTATRVSANVNADVDADVNADVDADAQRTRREFVWRLPKAELHLQLETTLEPKLLLELAERNRVPLTPHELQEMEAADSFHSWQSFLRESTAAQSVLRTERDFCELAGRYFERVAGQGVRHVELYVEAQKHAARGIPFATLFYGVTAAIDRAQRAWGISTALLPCLQSHPAVESALKTIATWRPYRARLAGVGLEVREGDERTKDIEEILAAAGQLKLNLAPYTNTDGPAQFVRQELSGMHVTVREADLAGVGGFMVDHVWACWEQLRLTNSQIVELAKRSFAASHLPESRRQQLCAEVDEYQRCFGVR